MARSAAGEELTKQHRRQQLALRSATVRDVVTLWALWDPARPSTFDEFAAAATVLVQSRHRDSAGLAAGYYQAFRIAEGVPGEPTPRVADRPRSDAVRASLRATGLDGTLRAVRAGQSVQQALQTGLVQVSGSASRLALKGGRQTIVDSLKSDRRARGWQRVASGSACYFCRMIAGRGPVFSEQTGYFQAHDHCVCTAEPFYVGSKVSEQNLRFRREWYDATSPGGLRGKEAINAYRRSLAA